MKKTEKKTIEKRLSMRSLLRDVYIENKLKENRNSPKEGNRQIKHRIELCPVNVRKYKQKRSVRL